MITGVRFNADNVRRVAHDHAVTAPIAAAASLPKVKAVNSSPASVPPVSLAPRTNAPPLIETIPAAPIMVGLPADVLSVSVKEAISILGVCRTTIYKLAGEGALTLVKVGGRSRILAEGICVMLGAAR